MKKLDRDTIRFFEKQRFVIVSTIDPKGGINTAAKGIVGIDKKGNILLLDLYRGKTHQNLNQNPNISITAIDERQYIGYNLKGRAKIIDKIDETILETWKDHIVSRISHRVLQNIKEEAVTREHYPEAQFPSPKYLIEAAIEEIVDLAPKK